MWWSIGILTYGAGTFLEAAITVTGNTVTLTKMWYIAGALLGGYPLAQGSVYLHLSRRIADILTYITGSAILFFSAAVALSPIRIENLTEYKPSGDILVWSWIRMFTPLINFYAVLFLVGGALASVYFYIRHKHNLYKAVGNLLIAGGAILPGIGGSLAKAGYVEALYIGELLGIILIWIGYMQCTKDLSFFSNKTI